MLRGLAVGIVVDGTAAVVAEVAECRRGLHHVAQSRQDELSVVGVDGGFHLDASVGADGVDNVLRELEVIHSERLVFLLSEALPVAVGSLEACAVGCLALNAVEHRNTTVEVLHHLMLLSLMLQVVEAVLIPVLIHPVVVVHPCAEGVELRAAAVFKHFLAAVAQAADAAVGIAELHVETVSADENLAILLGDVHVAFHILYL